MSDRDWYQVDKMKPPEGKEVRVMSCHGQVARLTRRGDRYWFPCMTYFVRWTPAYWQHIEEEDGKAD